MYGTYIFGIFFYSFSLYLSTFTTLFSLFLLFIVVFRPICFFFYIYILDTQSLDIINMINVILIDNHVLRCDGWWQLQFITCRFLSVSFIKEINWWRCIWCNIEWGELRLSCLIFLLFSDEKSFSLCLCICFVLLCEAKTSS